MKTVKKQRIRVPIYWKSLYLKSKIASGTLRKYYFYDPPQIFTIVLKRFRQTSLGKFEKVNTAIKFEDNLVLDPFVLRKGI